MRAVPVLQARAFRSVSLEREGGAEVVVKRFHHPNPVLALFDATRARREHAALAALASGGTRVPRPLGIRPASGGWELRIEAIPGARPLSEALAEAAPEDGRLLFERLGALLAALQRSGWRHGDLHPGNVLVDAAGEPWLIDLSGARRVSLDGACDIGELAALIGHVRESVPFEVWRPAVRAWRAGLPANLRPDHAGAELEGVVAARARVFRRRSVRAHLGRWLRYSSRARPCPESPGTLVRRDLEGVAESELRARAALVAHGPREEVRARWLGAARLREHGLPVLAPTLHAPGGGWSGRGARAFFEPESCAPSEEIASLLADRGITVHGLALVHAGGAARILPPREGDVLDA
jgi:tRNA A-37 threonylcarbamoyl transferase component Bud32